MNVEAIENHLQSWKSKSVVLSYLMAVLAFFLGLLVMFLIFWLAYAALFAAGMGIAAFSELIGNKQVHLNHHARLIGSGVFLVLLFIQHLRDDPWHYGDYPERDYKSAPILQFQAGLAGAFATMLAYPGATANIISDCLMSGPRLLCGCWRLFRRVARLRKIDVSTCAQLLFFLLQQAKATPYEQLHEAGWKSYLPMLQEMEGVVFLEKGVVLSEDFRAELAAIQG